jgi:nucleotide-binding universal stress UspA family protein
MFEKILVATDGSEHSMKAVQCGLEFAEKHSADVTLMSVSYYAKAIYDEMPLDIQSKLEAEAQAALDKAKALFAAKGIEVTTVLDSGVVPANNIIERAAQGKFDLILIGSAGVHGLGRILMGSTTAKVVAHAPCSVAAIK